MAIKKSDTKKVWKASKVFWVVTAIVFVLGFVTMSVWRSWEAFNRGQAEYSARVTASIVDAQTIALQSETVRNIKIQDFTYTASPNIYGQGWFSKQLVENYQNSGKVFVSRSVWSPEKNKYVSRGGVLLQANPQAYQGSTSGAQPAAAFTIVKVYDSSPGSDLLQYGFSQEFVADLQ